MVALLLFLPWRPSRNVASPFSSVMVCMSAPVSLMSPLLSHTARKGTRATHLSKVVPITWCNIHYMVPRPTAVKAEMRRGGSGKPDYRNRGGSFTVSGGCSKTAYLLLHTFFGFWQNFFKILLLS